MSTNTPQHETPPWLLKRADQATVGVLVLAALVSLTAWWYCQGGVDGRLIEIDRAPRRTARFLVDVNKADWPELAQLPGIGETLAQRIVAARDERGPFLDHAELRRVRGIGPKTLEKIRPFLRPIPPAANVAGDGHGQPSG
ncbi:MAG TPA: helix-hairpin-helix domain-containing protein [Pirellulales bacterium]